MPSAIKGNGDQAAAATEAKGKTATEEKGRNAQAAAAATEAKGELATDNEGLDKGVGSSTGLELRPESRRAVRCLIEARRENNGQRKANGAHTVMISPNSGVLKLRCACLHCLLQVGAMWEMPPIQ